MLILASSSPRRQELLKLLVPDFTIVKPIVDESWLQVSASETPLQEAKMKAYAVLKDHPHDEILACDTVVILHNHVLGKPKNTEEAFSMLKSQAGQKQVVVSGYCYIGQGKEITRSVRTYVYFNKLSDERIKEYIQKFHPLDKAGAYGIQDDYPLIERIEGSYYNVMGLPVEDLQAHVFTPRR